MAAARVGKVSSWQWRRRAGLPWPRASAQTRDISGRAWAQSHHRLTIPVLLLALCFSMLCGWVLLHGRRATEARAERIREALAPRAGADDAQRRSAQLSIGVACLVPDIGIKHQDLIAAADKALYQAKHLGRNRTELAETRGERLAPDADAYSARAVRGKGNPVARNRSSAAA